MGQYLLGIDNGGTVTKAALYDLDGVEVAVASARTETLYPQPGQIERDLDKFWAGNAGVIAEVIRRARVDTSRIAGISVTGHGCGMYMVAEDGSPSYNGIISTDSRASAYVKRYYQDGTFQQVLPLTCQSIWASQPAALLPWFRDNMPEVLHRTRWVLSCKDYIRYKLTGVPRVEVTDYSGTSLLNIWKLDFDPKLLELFGISYLADKFPQVCQSADICGQVTPEAAAVTGLKAGTPVAGGLFDVSACAIASGIVDEDTFCLIAGTWSINEYISRAPVQAPDLFMSSAYCMPGYWLILEGSPTSASNLEWFVREFIETSGKNPYDECNELVQSIPPEESQIIFLPFLFGSNAGPSASSGFLGLHGWHRKAHLLRAIFEGVVFSHRTHIDRLMNYREPAKRVRIAGGAARSSVWVKIFADALQLPIEVTASEELGALGAAICAGVGVGLFISFPEAVSHMVHVSRTVDPDPAVGGIYEEKYRKYQDGVTTLGPLWDRHEL